MRLRFQKRVEALKKAGIPVNQQTVYDESIEVGVPVPKPGQGKGCGKRESTHAQNRPLFVIEFFVSGIVSFAKHLFRPRKRKFASPAPPRPVRRLSRQDAILYLGIGSFSIVVGTFLTILGGYYLNKASQCRTWPTTDGTILTQVPRVKN